MSLKCSLKKCFKSGFKRGAKYGFKTDFITTFKINLKHNKKTDSIDYYYMTSDCINFLNIQKEILKRKIMKTSILDGMNSSSIDQISRSEF